MQALGARWLRYCSFVPTGRARDPAIRAQIEPDPEQLDRFFERLRGWRARGGSRLGLLVDHAVGPWTKEGVFRCRAGTHIGYVTARGDLYPCTGLLFEPFRVGNVLEQPLVELLGSAAMRSGGRARRSELAEPCRSCTNRRCSGGCRGAVYAATGDRYGALPYCNVWRRMTGAARRGA
jgi:radical SAM protein with 4Fe4S-binding SPASM domain